jgi:predicted esterase
VRGRGLRLAAAAALVWALLCAASGAAAGPREEYERRRNEPPRVVRLAGLLGHAWVGDPPYIAGATRYSRGEWIHQDRPFDDTGADTSPDDPAVALQDGYPGLCETTAPYRHGEYEYPADPALLRNGADLVELRIAVAGDRVHVLLVLQTLIDPNRVAARLVLAGSHEVLLRGSVATLDGTAVPAAADPVTNALELSLPAAALPGGPITVAVEVGVPADGAATTWVDTAFVDEPLVGDFNCWGDKAQSKVLAGTTLPSATVDVDRLRAGASDPPSLPRGPMVRLHPPSFAAGEGITPEPSYGQGGTASIYRGTLEPYAAYVPQSYDPARPAPVLMLLHCLNCNHNTFQIAAWPGLGELAEELGAIVVTPLAFGEARHYVQEAELDVFDVLADVSSRYAVDPDRLLLGGMSMGSLGTFKLGLLYPDLWARTIGVGNYTTPLCVSPTTAACGEPSYFRFFENARNLPLGILNGTLDELTPVTLAREYAAKLAGLGYPYRFWEYQQGRHNPALHGQTVDATLPWLTGARRVTDPARVTYMVDRSLFDPAFGLTYDRAYWVRDIRLAEGAGIGHVDATAGAGTAISTAPFSASGTSVAGPWQASGLDPVLAHTASGNRIAATVTGIASLTITDAPRLDTSAPLSVEVTSDREVAITVTGVGTTTAPAGHSAVVITPGGAVSPALLPATGRTSGPTWLLFGAAVGMLALVRRGRLPRR